MLIDRLVGLAAWERFSAAASRLGLFEQLMLVGSLRRGQPLVHDVDMVGILKIKTEPTLMAGQGKPYAPFLDWVMVNADKEAPEGTKSTATWVPKNPIGATNVHRKIVRFYLNGIEMDVYLTKSNEFWPLVVVRTGPQRAPRSYGPDDPGACQNAALAARAKRLGLKMAMSGAGLTNRATGESLGWDSEHAFFRALGLPYCPPEHRDHPDWIALIRSSACSFGLRFFESASERKEPRL